MTALPTTPSASPSPAPPRKGRISKERITGAATLRDGAVVLFLILLFVVLSFTTDTFLTVGNLKNVVDSSVGMGLIACAGTVVIIAGGFDLSAAAIFAVSAIVGVKVGNHTQPALGIAAGILAGCVLGLVNGLLVTVGRINHFVGTLGTMIAYGGLATAISGSGLLLVTDPSFANFANTQFLGFRLSSWFFVGVALLCSFLLNFTVFGRQAFATGGNLAAARLSGVSTGKTLVAAYILSGGAAAIAGLVVAARSLSVGASSGANLIFDALAAILIGGNSVLGGQGAIWRTLVGVFTLALISNGFNLIGVDPIYQQIVSGSIILLAVGVDAWTRSSSHRT
ncbi:ABC transporter permease [Streptomyces sp. NPDC057474]|uniref:ABC transporter permease n=1 Tax=Streptomyces sp. NPDC057474 TaxID=3346144 RepID=UPI003678CB1E